jgi:sugar-specific transcriptional regulator TrmB
MKKRTYEVMMMIEKKRNQKKKSKKKSKNEWKKKKKEKSALIASRSWWCDASETRCVLSSSKIYEECSSYFVSTRRCLRSFSSALLRDLKSDIANVVEETSTQTMKETEKISVDNWWKKLKKQKSWSRSNERWWKKTFWESWRKSWRRS